MLTTGREAEATAREALAVTRAADHPAATTEALMELAYTLLVQYREAEGYPVAREAAALASQTRDTTLLAEARLMEASCAPTVQAATQAARLPIEHFQRTGHASRLLDLHGTLAELALAQHDDEAAKTFVEQAKAAAPRVPAERERTWVHGSEGFVLLMTGEVAGARHAFATELRLARRWLVEEVLPEALYGFAATCAAEYRHQLAAQLRGAAEALFAEPVHPALRHRVEERYFEPARRSLGDACWHRASLAGQRLSIDEALALTGITD